MSDDLGTIGDKLRELREALGMSRVDLEVASGVKIGTIIKIEQNVARPRSDNVMRLADALGVTPNQLLGYEDSPKKKKAKTTTRGRFKQGVAKQIRGRRASGNHPFTQPAYDQPVRAVSGF